MKVILVRHGETVENKNKISQGWIPGILSDLGREQAEKLAEKLKNEKIDVIYTSDLARAKDTAEKISKFHNVELILDKRLREQNKGIYTGKPWGTSQKVIDEKGLPWHEFKPEEGESFSELFRRVSKCFEDVIEKNSGKNVLIVTHGGVLSCLGCYINREKLGEIRKYSHKNAGITYLELVDGKWEIIKLNDTKHLE